MYGASDLKFRPKPRECDGLGQTIPILTVSKQNHCLKDIYFVIYGIISDFTDKGQFQYLTNLKGPQEGTYLYTTQFLSLR